MSEYQYYEFQALDRPLADHEIDELRSHSTRATITATRFVNHYEWGDFKGDSFAWMEKYFDAFLYLANWGTHQVMFRLPRRLLNPKSARQYCCGTSASVRVKGDAVILDFVSQEESDEWDDDGRGWLPMLIPLRADLAGGDLRALYLAWLACVQTGELKHDAMEPPVPAGLGELTASLQSFADFLRIDKDLIAAAAARSPQAGGPSCTQEVKQWIAALPDNTKTDWLVRLTGGGEPHLRAELLRRFQESQKTTPSRVGKAPRTVAALLTAAERLAKDRQRKEAEQAAVESARREREEAEARKRYLAVLAKREPMAWQEVEALVTTKTASKYDQAVTLLRDLRDVGVLQGREGEITERLLQLREEHATKLSFIKRLEKEGLI